MITQPWPTFYPLRDESHQSFELKDVDPKEVLGWIGLATAAVAGGRWMWKKVIKPVGENLWAILCIGSIARRVEKRVDELAVGVALAQARSRVLLNARGDVAIWESNAQGECTFASRFMLEVLGRPFEDVAGNNWRSIIADKDKADVISEWDSNIADGLDFNREYHWIHRNGSHIPVRVTSERIIESGKVIGWLCEAKIIHSFILE
jgi:PAS domain S-box-containing protein